MKTANIIFTVLILTALAGCQHKTIEQDFLTVDFQKGRPLRYEFVSSKHIDIDWPMTKKGPQAGKKKVDSFSEYSKIVIAYNPIEVDPYGLTTIEATCESVNVNRSKREGKESSQNDALNSLVGKTFTFTIWPTGRIEDYSQIEKLARETAGKAFRPRSSRGNVKEPDMTGDFIATQWFLWDAVSSMENPLEALNIGRTWNSQLSVPAPMIMKKARDVTYTLAEIRQTDKGRIAVINSFFSLAPEIRREWPLPYPDGSFQMSGTFGFLRGYKTLELQGQGEELFNIDLGRTEEYTQKYIMELQASFPMGIDLKPKIKIEQYLGMKLLGEQEQSKNRE